MSPLTTSSVSSRSGIKPQRAGCAERLALPLPVHVEPGGDRLGLREVRLDQLAEMADADVGPVARRLRASQSKISSRIGRSPTGNERLWQHRRVGAQPRAQAAGEHRRSHRARRSRRVLVGPVAMRLASSHSTVRASPARSSTSRLPARQLGRPAEVAEQSRHLAATRAQPLRVELDLEPVPDELADQLRQLADRHVAAAAELQRARRRRRRPRRSPSARRPCRSRTSGRAAARAARAGRASRAAPACAIVGMIARADWWGP